MNNPHDRADLLRDAMHDELSSAEPSDRIRRGVGASAQAGRPHDPTPYGYRRVSDSRTGELVAQEIEPDEGKVVRELFHRLKAGHSLKSDRRRL